VRLQSSRRSLLALYEAPDAAAQAVGNLREAGIELRDLEILTDTPYPEGAFGEGHTEHRLFGFPLIGAACGFAVGLLLTIGTQLDYPLVTGGKPILSIPPMFNVMYEGTMLGAIIFTVLGILFESRLPWFGGAPYDPRISAGMIGVLSAFTGNSDTAERIHRQAGAVDVIRPGESRTGVTPRLEDEPPGRQTPPPGPQGGPRPPDGPRRDQPGGQRRR
jgi:Alternative complex III, ActD subunit